jgi:hypothetical protein
MPLPKRAPLLALESFNLAAPGRHGYVLFRLFPPSCLGAVDPLTAPRQSCLLLLLREGLTQLLLLLLWQVGGR